MKRLIFIFFTFICISANSQTVNRFRDSSWFAKGVRFDSAIYLIKGASNGKVLTSDANGRATWQTFSGSGVTQSTLNDSISAVRSIRKVDTLYRNIDSLVFKINGIRYAIIDSSGGGGGSQDLQQTLTNGNTTGGQNISISNGDAIILDNSSMLKKGTIDAGLGGVNGIAQICAVGYELKWEAGRLYVMGSNGNTIRQSLYNFTTTPTVNDDDLDGYGIGSLWTLDDNTTYVCLDATTANAVWIKISNTIFSNGVKIIEDTTYTLSSSDAGYCLVATNANTHFIMPSIIPFKEGDIIGITADLDVTTFDLNSIATDIELFTGELSENGETIILQCVDVEGLNMLPLSAIIDDNGTLKTLNKYLYDKSQNAISVNILSDSLAQIRTEIADTSALLRGLITTPTFSLSKNSAKDSIVTVFNGVRSAVRDSIGGGGASLSDLTAGTATNTINSTDKTQTWQWNSLGANNGLVLSSSSTSALTGSTPLSVESSGTIANSQTTYGLKVSNTKVSASGVNYGLDLNLSGSTVGIGLNIRNTCGSSTGINITSGMTVGIQMNRTPLYFNSNTQGIIYFSGYTDYKGGANQHFFTSTSVTPVTISTSTSAGYFSIVRPTGGHGIVFGGDLSGSSYRSEGTTNNVITSIGGALTISGNTGVSGGFATFTKSDILTVQGGATAAAGNVGIGTTTPVASAKLELSSTTMGFLPPRMTTTQINAIASPAEGLVVYNTTLNVLCFYDGTGWKKCSHTTM